jgi:hypothetical protein
MGLETEAAPPPDPPAPRMRVDPDDYERLLERGAELAVDMEEGRYQKADGSYWVGAYSKSEINVALGGRRVTKGLHHPAWMDEPRFSNWVQFERIKRTAHSKMSIDEAKPLVAVGAGALLLELVKRALTKPESIGNRELFLETRKWVELLKDIDDRQEDKSDPRTIINNFFLSVNRLPKGAGEKAMALFETDLTRTMAAAKRPKAIEAKKAS